MLVLSMHDELIYAERLLAAGASGYIMKQAASDQLLVALRRVLAGDRYVQASRWRRTSAGHEAAPMRAPRATIPSSGSATGNCRCSA